MNHLYYYDSRMETLKPRMNPTPLLLASRATLPDGCKILVNRASRSPRDGRIFVLQTAEGLVAKRLARTRNRWELRSDNSAHQPQPWALDDEVIGEVRWMGTTL